MSTEEMLVIKRGYDLSKWLLNHTGKFPKSYRFSVAAKMENAILDFIELTSVANMRHDKLPLLKRADEALARVRLLLRLSYEMRFINIKSYEYGSPVDDCVGDRPAEWLSCGVELTRNRRQLAPKGHPEGHLPNAPRAAGCPRHKTNRPILSKGRQFGTLPALAGSCAV